MATVTEDNLHFGSDPDDPNGVRDCTTCTGSAIVDAAICPDCHSRQQLRTAWWNSSAGPEHLRRTLTDL